MKKKLFSLIALMLIACMLFSACNTGTGTGDDTPTDDPGTEDPGTEDPGTEDPGTEDPGTEDPGTEDPGDGLAATASEDLTIGMIGEAKTMDPSQVSDLVSFMVFFQIYDNLIQFDQDDKLVPALAESWDYNQDGTEITFHLRDDVTFWDGTPLTAEDVVFSYERAIESSYTSSSTNMMDRMEYVDENTCKLILKFPYGPIEYCIGSAQLGIISKAHFEKVGAEGYSRDPMGTGAYEYVSWASGDKIVIKANENYWKGSPRIKNVTFKIITDGTTAVLALQNGEVDLIDTPPKADRQSLVDDSNINYLETEIAASVFVAFNNGKPPFDDVKVRKAFMMAIDKQQLVEGAVEGLGTPLNTWWPTPIGGWDDNTQLEGIPYDPEGAKALLAEAGYENGLTVTLLTTDSQTYNKPTEVYQQMLRDIGVTANIEKLERSTFFDRVQSDRDYEVCVLASTTSVPDVDYIYSTFHSSNISEGRNYMVVDNAELDRLLEEGRAETDQEKRYEIYRQVAELWNEEVFSGCLYTYLTPIATHKDIAGLHINSKNRFFIYDLYWAA